MSVQTEILTERINKIDELLSIVSEEEKITLLDEKTNLVKQLASSNVSLNEGRQLLKG